MRHNMQPLLAAIQDRRMRAIEVRKNYAIEFAGMGCYVVTEPEEPERSYLVDSLHKRCTCPDWACQDDKENADHGCKHVFAICEKLGIKIDDEYQRRVDESLAFVARQRVVHTPDPSNPFRD